MINDSMKSNKYIGMVQPKSKNNNTIPLELYNGCMGKIMSKI